MKLGLLCCFYGISKYLDRVIQPWIETQSLFNTQIAVVHGLFKECHELGYVDDDVDTIKVVNGWQKSHNIFFYIQNPPGTDQTKFQTEAEIRNVGLQYLLDQQCDYVMLLDNDEIYSAEEIKKMMRFVENDPFCAWYRIEMKNLVFSEDTYIKGFSPPRIFKVNMNGLKLYQIYWDNDMSYANQNGTLIKYTSLPSKTIPTLICNPLHFTWLNDEISKRKIDYQNKHFAHGAGCSFMWDKDKGLVWNPTYFEKTGQTPPELFSL